VNSFFTCDSHLARESQTVKRLWVSASAALYMPCSVGLLIPFILTLILTSMRSHISLTHTFFSYYALHFCYFFTAYYCHLISYLIFFQTYDYSLLILNLKIVSIILSVLSLELHFLNAYFRSIMRFFYKIYLFLRDIFKVFNMIFSNIWWVFESFIQKYVKSWLNLTFSDHWYNELKHYSLSTDVFD
jgi:hypothetical protein